MRDTHRLRRAHSPESTPVHPARTAAHTPAAPAGTHNFAQISVGAPVAPQAKLTVNTPGDVYEQEADRVAEQVTQMEAPSAGEAPVTGRADDELQAKALPGDTQATSTLDADV